MSDIVERLRGNLGDGIKHHPSAIKLEAAAEIERLRRIIGYLEDHADIPISVRQDARRALEPKP